MPSPQPERILITTREVCRMLGVSPPTMRRLIKASKFPAPILLGRRSHRWRREDVLDAVEKLRTEAERSVILKLAEPG